MSIVMIALMMILLCGQFVTGKNEYNEERQERGETPASSGEYFGSGHLLTENAGKIVAAPFSGSNPFKTGKVNSLQLQRSFYCPFICGKKSVLNLSQWTHLITRLEDK